MDGVGDAGQLVELGDAVHACGVLLVQDAVEQGQVVGAAAGVGRSANVGAEFGEFGRGQDSAWVGAAVGQGEDFVVGVDDVLDFGAGGGFVGAHGWGGQGALDGGQVVGRVGAAAVVDAVAHAADTSVFEVGHGGRSASVGVGVGLDGGHGAGVGGDGGRHHALQFAQAVRLGAVVVFQGNGLQHGGQVAIGHIAQAHQVQVGRVQRWVGRLARRGGLDGVGDAGQVVQFGHAVDVAGLAGAHDVVEQRQFHGVVGGGTNVCANGRVVAGQWVFDCGVGHVVARVGVAVVGFGQDLVVGVDDALHLAAIVGFVVSDGSGGQGRVDHGHRRLTRSTDAGDAEGCVVECGGRGVGYEVNAVVSGIVSDGAVHVEHEGALACKAGVACCVAAGGRHADGAVAQGGEFGGSERDGHGGEAVACDGFRDRAIGAGEGDGGAGTELGFQGDDARARNGFGGGGTVRDADTQCQCGGVWGLGVEGEAGVACAAGVACGVGGHCADADGAVAQGGKFGAGECDGDGCAGVACDSFRDVAFGAAEVDDGGGTQFGGDVDQACGGFGGGGPARYACAQTQCWIGGCQCVHQDATVWGDGLGGAVFVGDAGGDGFAAFAGCKCGDLVGREQDAVGVGAVVTLHNSAGEGDAVEHDRDGAARGRVGGAGEVEALCLFLGVDAAVARDEVECEGRCCGVDFEFVGTDVCLGHAPSGDADTDVIGAVGQSGEAADVGGVECPLAGRGVVTEAVGVGADHALEGGGPQGDGDLVAGFEFDEVGRVCLAACGVDDLLGITADHRRGGVGVGFKDGGCVRTGCVDAQAV